MKTNILAISAFYHDSAACLIQDGNIICAAQEELFTRKKHDFSFPINAVNYCLDNSGIKIRDVDYIVFHEKSFLKFERILETYLTFAPIGVKSFVTSMPLWIKEKLWIKEIIRRELAYSGEIIFPEHHESHAASAFFPSPFKEAAILTIDAVGEWATATYGVGKDNQINIIADIRFPHSVGLLYSAFTYYLGFKVNSGEYKVMGLAPYGELKFKEIILSKLIDLKEDGSFKLNMTYFNYCAGLTMTNKRFNDLFGDPPRKPESKITQKHMDIARSIQEVTEQIMLLMAKHVYKKTGQKKLCLAGGVALNCVGNGRILREGPYDDIWIQPAAGDAGGALGAALFTWYQYLNRERIINESHDSMSGAQLGPGFSEAQILDFLKQSNIAYTKVKKDEIPEKIADLIAKQNVIGWFQGRAEFGPRALGNRSILGDARSPIMQKKINHKIKFRESFRPFAPAVTEKKVSEYFVINCKSPYMLLVAPVKEELRTQLRDEQKNAEGIDKLDIVRSVIPAVTHVDYSARVQSVGEENNSLFYKLIDSFGKKYDHPVIINTSFNVREEPKVCSPEDAYNCFMRTGMDYLIIEDFLISKKNQKDLKHSYRNFSTRKMHTLLEEIQSIKDSEKDIRKFSLGAGIAFLILGLLFILFGKIHLSLLVPIGLFFLVVRKWMPKLLKPVYKVWMSVAITISYLLSRLILGISFYLLLTPIGILSKLFGKDFLHLISNGSVLSYWNIRIAEEFRKESYKKQF